MKHAYSARRTSRYLGMTIHLVLFASAAAHPALGQCAPTQQTQLTASDAGDSDSFGISVAVYGDAAVVGSVFDDHDGFLNAGSAYVFLRTGNVWTQQAKLTAMDAADGDYFGASVAISGNTVVVGANNSGATDAGAAYVFVRAGTVWTQQAKLTALDAAMGDGLGYSVALDGDTAVVGAWLVDVPGQTDAGAAYVFVRTGSVWTRQAKLTALDPGVSDNLGYSVSLSGDTAVVGAWLDDNAGGNDAGAAYVFVRSGTSWTQQAKLTALDASAFDSFGNSVAVSSNTAVVGAFRDDNAGGADAGSAYVFVRSGTIWSEQQRLAASDATAGDNFGASVGLSGNTAVVGARKADLPGATDAGAAYVFTRSGTVWAQKAKLTASDAAAQDSFGIAAAIDGDTAVVGASDDDLTGGFNNGSAYAFKLNCAVAGDLDGDGDVDDADMAILVAVLLGQDVNPSHIAAADIDHSGSPNGRDIQPFVIIRLGG